jgi:hypothetical protein
MILETNQIDPQKMGVNAAAQFVGLRRSTTV